MNSNTDSSWTEHDFIGMAQAMYAVLFIVLAVVSFQGGFWPLGIGFVVLTAMSVRFAIEDSRFTAVLSGIASSVLLLALWVPAGYFNEYIVLSFLLPWGVVFLGLKAGKGTETKEMEKE